MRITIQLTKNENLIYFGSSVLPIDLESYVASVVSAEIGDNVPLEAAKAQAVAARTYAINFGVDKGKVISDDPSKHQGFRAKFGERAAKAVVETKGQILTYKDKPINCVYCSSNGGIQLSSAEVWGGNKPYLINQPDEWTRLSGYKKKGHGVGMSQRGCIYAAEHGFKYDEILSFYYPYTQLVTEYKMEIVREDLLEIKNRIEQLQNYIDENF